MNLNRCTPQQREVVTTQDAPLMVAAGAGSGKTYTLTQRIVAALVPDDQGKCHVSSVEEVCAITFTRKAAAELRSRVKSSLIDEGMVEAALAVDGAWISTIHSMAERILREQALELGLDPNFEILTEAQVTDIQLEAANQVMSEDRDSDASFDVLFDGESIDPFDKDKGGVGELALRVMNRAMAQPRGFDALDLGESPYSPQDLLREIYDLGCEFEQYASVWEKPTKYEQEALERLDAALENARIYLDRDDCKNADFCDESFDIDEYRAVFYAFPPTSDKFHAKKDDADFFATYRSEYARLCDEVETAAAQRKSEALVRFARAIHERMAEIKGSSRLDNNDVLALCYQALCEHPEIAAYYRDRFRLIMIDEFQDTDKLQVALIGQLAQPNLANVCTVGDAQQSIYRFRGADVEVFLSYRQELLEQNPAAHFVALPDNFRSHADVLALVDSIFRQPQVFGDEFLHLEPRAALNEESDPLFDADQHANPRLALDVVHYNNRSTSKNAGVSAGEARLQAARHIAERFAQLRADGAQAKDMVLLLGGMTHADVYARALLEAGLESIVTGGSVFSTTDEAILVDNLLHVAVNMHDEPALLGVLTSSLFALPDDALLALTSRYDDDGAIHSRSLSQGFIDPDGGLGMGLSEQSEQALTLARNAVSRFVHDAHEGRVTKALRNLFTETGLFDRFETMGADGLARAGNVAKALALVESFEDETTGISSLAKAFRDHLSYEKETPGALSTVNSDFVRIMTVHSAKGLEFAHVAVAELGTGINRRGRFYAENVGENVYVSMSTSATGDQGATIGKLRNFDRADAETDVEQAETLGQCYKALQTYSGQQSLAEARRLLYVAITRAARSVMVSVCTNSNPQNGYANAGIYQDIYTALQWDTEADKSVSLVDCGANSPVKVTFERLRAIGGGDEDEAYDEDEAHDENEAGAEGDVNEEISDSPAHSFVVTQREPLDPMVSVPSAGLYDDVYSYTSLSEASDVAPAVSTDESPDVAYDELYGELPESEEFIRPRDEEATDLGTAFHRLSQRSVLRRNMSEQMQQCTLAMPSTEEILSVAQAQELSDSQTQRLINACERWFTSDFAHRIATGEDLRSEVPFMVALDEGSQHFYLEGAIDLLATYDDDAAEVVDFKTGGSSSETPDELYEKHLFQAQCYAFALLIEGFSHVEAHFVRVEHVSTSDSRQPQRIDYTFTHDDLGLLHDTICDAYRTYHRVDEDNL